eukprot:1143792-Pelagomonas_calceolata.AAC.2
MRPEVVMETLLHLLPHRHVDDRHEDDRHDDDRHDDDRHEDDRHVDDSSTAACSSATYLQKGGHCTPCGSSWQPCAQLFRDAHGRLQRQGRHTVRTDTSPSVLTTSRSEQEGQQGNKTRHSELQQTWKEASNFRSDGSFMDCRDSSCSSHAASKRPHTRLDVASFSTCEGRSTVLSDLRWPKQDRHTHWENTSHTHTTNTMSAKEQHCNASIPPFPPAATAPPPPAMATQGQQPSLPQVLHGLERV